MIRNVARTKCKKLMRILIPRKHHGPYSTTFGHFRATDVPRNPFISCRCSLDATETIRYTWNQLARSAGKWVKGLTAPKRGEGRGKREERRTDAWSVAAVWEMTLYHCRVHLPSCVSSLLVARIFPFFVSSLCPFSVSTSLLLFLFLHPAIFSLRVRFSSSSRAPMTCLCLRSPILLPTNGSSHGKGWTRLRDKILRHFHRERPQLNRR